MADLRGFDANNHEPNQGFEPLPAGNYNIVIVGSELKNTKAGTGQFLELQLEVVSGDQKGRRLWDRLNIRNPSEKAEQIAKGTLSAICRAIGIMTPNDSSELHNKPLQCKVKLVTGDRGEQNEVISYKQLPGTGTAEQIPQQAEREPW